MSDKTENITLSRDQLKSILTNAKVEPVDEPQVEASEYNWTYPHQFKPAHRVELAAFCSMLSGDLSEKFSEMCNGKYTVTIPRLTENYADTLRKDIGEENANYYMTFQNDKKEILGSLILPEESAIQWSAIMLGDPAPEATEGYELSSLEESLLTDLSNALIETFSDNLVKHNMQKLTNNTPMTHRDWPIECLGYENISLIPLQVEHFDNTLEASLVVFSSVFGPMLDIDFPREGDGDREEMKKAVMANLRNTSLEVDVLLGNANVAMSDMMNVREGDVIVLDRKAQYPADIMIEGRTFFLGRPAKSLNRYALAITDVISSNEDGL